MKLDDFQYDLPRELVAQRPLPDRAAARLLLLERVGNNFADRFFHELPQLLRGDELLVVNNTQVLPARLFGKRRGVRAERRGKHSRGFLSAEIEVLLTRRMKENEWEALVRPGRKMKVGEQVVFGQGELEAEVIARGELGLRRLRFSASQDVTETIEKLGHVPLPPYIERPDDAADRTDYQTIFAREKGAVAAPTASLHFTREIVERLKSRGIEICEITLHVGLATFQPIHVEEVERHQMPGEEFEISESSARQIIEAKRAKRPVLAVGTTVVRALEDAAQKVAGGAKKRSTEGLVPAGRSQAELFIFPGYRFRVVDQLLTNFHLPKSSLLVLVSAFAGRERILHAYRHAIERRYRFYSYGDCMLIR